MDFRKCTYIIIKLVCLVFVSSYKYMVCNVYFFLFTIHHVHYYSCIFSKTMLFYCCFCNLCSSLGVVIVTGSSARLTHIN